MERYLNLKNNKEFEQFEVRFDLSRRVNEVMYSNFF